MPHAESPAAAPPPLRPDLTISVQRLGGRVVAIVKDPIRRTFFRLGEAEHFIARQFDGVAGFEEIRQRTERELGATLSPATFRAFVERLRRARLLDLPGAADAKSSSRRLRGGPLRITLRLVDPDRVFAYLAARTSGCFSPAFLIVTGVIILLALATIAGERGTLLHDLQRLLTPSAIPLFIVTMFVVVSLHEVAHGVTCKHFGGDVHDVGMMLIYFQPALYCDVSDAWLFPERRKRLWVSFAGPYFELVIWGLSTLAWRVTESDTWVNHVALVVMATSGVQTLFNFNPFIKLDGYYLLGDWLQMPNLRRRAFRYVGGLTKRVFGLEAPEPAGLSSRERAILGAYGVLASLGTVSVLLFVVLTAGGYLIEGHGPTTVALAGGLIALRVRRRFRRMFARPGHAAADDEDEDDDPIDPGADRPAEPPRHATTPVDRAETARIESPPESTVAPAATPDPPAPNPRRRSSRSRARLIRRSAWITVAAGALGFVAFGSLELRIAGPFTVRPGENADVRVELEGIVSRVYVHEGDEIRVGDLVARLSAREGRAALAATEAQLDQARARLQLIEAGNRADSIELARTAVTRAQSALHYAQSRYERNKQLADNGFMTAVELETSTEQRDAARHDLAESERRLAVMSAGTRPEAIAAGRAEVRRLEATRALQSSQLTLVDVHSPAAGIVATPARELHDLSGQLVPKGALIARVFALRVLRVEIAVAEKEIADVAVGQAVVLRARAYPNTTLRGRVVSIAPALQGAVGVIAGAAAAQDPAVAKTVVVTTEIENPDLLLKPGMTGQAKILCGPRTVHELLLRRVARTLKVEVWSWW